MPRSTQEELNERLKVVADLIVRGFSAAEIVAHVDEHEQWNVTRRQVYNYYDKAFEMLADNSNVNRASYFKLSLDRLERQYRKAEDADDYRTAADITMNVIRFLKLDQPQADYDWTQAATNAGIEPEEVKSRLKRLMSHLPEDEEEEQPEIGASNGYK